MIINYPELAVLSSRIAGICGHTIQLSGQAKLRGELGLGMSELLANQIMTNLRDALAEVDAYMQSPEATAKPMPRPSRELISLVGGRP